MKAKDNNCHCRSSGQSIKPTKFVPIPICMCVSFSFKHFGIANRNHLSFIFRNQFCKALLGKCILNRKIVISCSSFIFGIDVLFCGMFFSFIYSLLEQKSNLTFHENKKKRIMRRGTINELWFLYVNNGCTFRYVFSSIFFANFHSRMNQAR